MKAATVRCFGWVVVAIWQVLRLGRMWSRSHAPWEAAARPAGDTSDSIEQAESRRIAEILRQNGTTELPLWF